MTNKLREAETRLESMRNNLHRSHEINTQEAVWNQQAMDHQRGEVEQLKETIEELQQQMKQMMKSMEATRQQPLAQYYAMETPQTRTNIEQSPDDHQRQHNTDHTTRAAAAASTAAAAIAASMEQRNTTEQQR